MQHINRDETVKKKNKKKNLVAKFRSLQYKKTKQIDEHIDVKDIFIFMRWLYIKYLLYFHLLIIKIGG